MIKCPDCGYVNVEGMLFCEDCGEKLYTKGVQRIAAQQITAPPAPPARPLNEAMLQNVSLPESQSSGETGSISINPSLSNHSLKWETRVFKQQTEITLHILDEDLRIILPAQSCVILGRYHEQSTQQPDIDLTPYKALEKGISRLHTALYRETDFLKVSDMNSANGTFLNGNKLVADRLYIIKHGDELQLGKIHMRVYFEDK